MSLKDDLKRIFFGAKAMAKSAAEKAAEAAKEAGEELAGRGEELLGKASEKASGLKDELLENTTETRTKANDTLGSITDQIWEETQYAMGKGRELKDKAEEWLNSKKKETEPDHDTLRGSTGEPDEIAKATVEPIDFELDVTEEVPTPPHQPSALEQTGDQVLDAAARTGAKALDAANEAGKKLMDASEEVGGKVLEVGDKIFDKAKELGADLANKAADMMERAQDEIDRETLQDKEAQAEQLAREAQERADNALRDTKDNLLDDKDDFFARAERYAQGDYHNKGGQEITIDPNPKQEKPNKRSGKAAGFEDRDGDGDEIIDDAIIDED